MSMRCFATAKTTSGFFAVLWFARFRPETGTEEKGESREGLETTVLGAAQPAASKAWRMGQRRSRIRRKGKAEEKYTRQWVKGKR